MSFFGNHYRDGQEICVGDIFTDGQSLGYVVAVLAAKQVKPGWESWLHDLLAESENGFLFIKSYGPCFFDESDEDQVLLQRGYPGVEQTTGDDGEGADTLKERTMEALREMEKKMKQDGTLT